MRCMRVARRQNIKRERRMKPKHKVLIYNFLGFASLFVLFRFGLQVLLTIDSFYLAVISAIAASFLAPKFANY